MQSLFVMTEEVVETPFVVAVLALYMETVLVLYMEAIGTLNKPPRLLMAGTAQ
ncbi:hypothetical protein DVH05_003485 [Phytophthora capsici]|nr:hypothetical protein DVH05_003485 [Phytophthora capsici]